MSVALTDTRLQSRSKDLLGAALSLSTLALAAVVISANFTNYGPLIPLLQHELHVTSGATGLLSTLLYVGIGLSYLPGGWLADRYGSRCVLFVALLLVGMGGCLLPVFPNLVWMVLCRLLIGLGAGAAIVAGSQTARRGKYRAFGQGLFGGAMQVGAGLGLFATPTLQGVFGWRGAFAAWGAFGLMASLLCLLLLRAAQDWKTVVTVDFLDRGALTEVVLTHEGLSTPERRARAEGGWPSLLDALAEVLSSPHLDL